ncbi:hypothetical protein DRO42_00170 [Candidatus Bathyarchaeota archaeon]|nr:MAG: hypothetical protein DRO42_00170 [Candidatus Bathyarchaeota archaeon]
MSSETIWDKLQNIDRKVFYWILWIGLMIPFIRPIGLPISIAPSTRDLYNGLLTLEEGDVVWINIAFGVSAWIDCMPATVACTKVILRQGAKLIVVGAYTDADLSWDKLRNSVPDFDQLEYGKDYVYLGYYTGGEAVVAQIASDIRSVFPTDAYGTPLDELPLMKEVNSVHDIDMVLSGDTGDWGDYYMRQWASPYGIPMAEIGIAMLASSYMPFYKSGLLFGISSSSRGGAELEKLIGEPGEATVIMDALSVSHLMVIAAVLLANIGYFATRGRRR